MASYNAAVAAIQQRLRDNWTTTPIAFPNGGPAVTVDENGNPVPWVFCEVTNSSSATRGGADGTLLSYLYIGLISLHVFTPVGSGDTLSQAYATQLGEIFRNARFYAPGDSLNQIRAWAPRIDGGGDGSDDGLWWRTTAVVPFWLFLRA